MRSAVETGTRRLDLSGDLSGNMRELTTSELVVRQEAGDCLLQDVILPTWLQNHRRGAWFSCLIPLAVLGGTILIVPQTSLL